MALDDFWPRAPVELVIQDRISEFRHLVRLVAAEGLLTDERRVEVARRLFDQGRPETRFFDQVSSMASILFAPTAHWLVDRWDAVRCIAGLAEPRVSVTAHAGCRTDSARECGQCDR